jgi:hypothetical protein
MVPHCTYPPSERNPAAAPRRASPRAPPRPQVRSRAPSRRPTCALPGCFAMKARRRSAAAAARHSDGEAHEAALPGAWLDELCRVRSAELTPLLEVLDPLDLALLACSARCWQQAIETFRAQEPSIGNLPWRWHQANRRFHAVPAFGLRTLESFATRFYTAVLPRYVSLRTLDLSGGKPAAWFSWRLA